MTPRVQDRELTAALKRLSEAMGEGSEDALTFVRTLAADANRTLPHALTASKDGPSCFYRVIVR